MLRRFHNCRKGLASVEMALISPVLGVLVYGVIDYSFLLAQHSDMQDAVRTAGHYVMVGGRSTSDAETFVNAAWEKRPEQSTLSVTRECRCGDVVQACSVNCADASAPEIYYAIRTTARVKGLLLERDVEANGDFRVR